jgi:agmatinase
MSDLLSSFNPNSVANNNSGIFGLPHGAEDAEIIVVPVPWEVTVSYGSGASEGPLAILEASYQLDLCHHDFPELWKKGIFMDEIPSDILTLSANAKPKSKSIIEALQRGETVESDPNLAPLYDEVNSACNLMNTWVENRCKYWLNQGKQVVLLGGDHSTPLGYLKTVALKNENFGLLVIDAHKDLRDAYEGFKYSHASIFFNALKEIPQISKLVQVGIRDYCHEEKSLCAENAHRISVFYDRNNRKRMYEGADWKTICDEIIHALPAKVYVSVDIDGLDPKMCPNTGTPVAGGLEYEELMYLLNRLKQSGKTIVGTDLCEVAPGENDWDGNVGARVLFQLCGLIGA